MSNSAIPSDLEIIDFIAAGTTPQGMSITARLKKPKGAFPN